jgi:DNA-binding response OmpR family regulator
MPSLKSGLEAVRSEFKPAGYLCGRTGFSLGGYRSAETIFRDDDPEVLSVTARVVSYAGYSVLEASTGAACLRLAKEVRPDLILLDVILPDTDGIRICRQIKADPSSVGTFVVMISGPKYRSGDQADGLDAGADGYIARPYPTGS